MKKKTTILIIIIIIILLITFLIMNIISLLKINSMKILDYNQIGLSGLIYTDVTKMYADSGWNPYLSGDFYNEEFLREIRELLSLGCFQEVRKPPTPLNYKQYDGLNTEAFVIFYTEDSSFYIGTRRGVVMITIDGETHYYNSNITANLIEMLNRYIETEFPEEEYMP